MFRFPKCYDVIVIGAGHAGVEAAMAAARLGCEVAVLTQNLDTIGQMSCNPAIGGLAKGHLVREIDALGGEMAKVTDRAGIQFRMLNMSKGPAVWSLRAQADRVLYKIEMRKVIESQQHLDVKQALVEKLVVEDGRIKGVLTSLGILYGTRAVIVTTGTFLKGLIHIGLDNFSSGRAGEFPSVRLSDSLRELGLQMGRLKTGTPPRLDAKTIDFSRTEPQYGDDPPLPFSHSTDRITNPQLPCYITYTNTETHKIILGNLDRSPLYSGKIKGIGARYCPSIEDKVVRFAERERHQVFLEPEGLETKEYYANGIPTSLPYDVQVKFVRTIPGLEKVEIMRPGYAIEYDFVFPTQLKQTLETKGIEGLFLAGQINGTSGYEEAAAQGMWAGINAACRVQKRPPFILDRSQAYIAVMVDDLVTRGTCEPYRMFTSRAEYRLMLREDNADLRLTEIGYELGLQSADTVKANRERKAQIQAEIQRIKKVVIKPRPEVNTYLEQRGTPPIDNGIHLVQLLKRAELGYDAVVRLSPAETPPAERVSRQVEIAIKYEGYIQRQLQEIDKFRHLEQIKLPEAIDYAVVHGLSSELKEKLAAVRPTSLGQASRIEGMTPAAISVLMVHLHLWKSR